MNLGVFHAHNVFNSNPAYSERIGDERTVATPWNRFRAHNRAPFLRSQFHQSVQPCSKCGRLHVISKAAKRSITPPHIDRIATGATQASELPQEHIADPGRSQLLRQRIPIKLRIVSRSRDTANIYDTLDAVDPQKPEEVLPCARRMPNRQHNGLFGLSLFHDETLFLPARPGRLRHWTSSGSCSAAVGSETRGAGL